MFSLNDSLEKVYQSSWILKYTIFSGTALRYLASELQRVADIELLGRPRSSSTALLHVPR